MSLGLTVLGARAGRKAAALPIPLKVEPISETVAQDIVQSKTPVKAQPLQRLTARHHSLAAELAAGVPASQVAAMFNMTPSYISVLKADKTFRDLLTFYESKQQAMFDVVNRRMQGVALEAINTLSDRIIETPDEVETSELTSIIKMAADRTGHAPKRVEEKNVNFNFGDRLDAARNRVKEKLIEGTAEEITDV